MTMLEAVATGRPPEMIDDGPRSRPHGVVPGPKPCDVTHCDFTVYTQTATCRPSTAKRTHVCAVTSPLRRAHKKLDWDRGWNERFGAVLFAFVPPPESR